MEQFQEFLSEEREDVNAKSMGRLATKSKGSKEEGEARIKPAKAIETAGSNPKGTEKGKGKGKGKKGSPMSKEERPRSLVFFIRCLTDV